MAQYSIRLMVNGRDDGVEVGDYGSEREARAELWLFLGHLLADEAERLVNAHLIVAELGDDTGTVVWRIAVAGGRPV